MSKSDPIGFFFVNISILMQYCQYITDPFTKCIFLLLNDGVSKVREPILLEISFVTVTENVEAKQN